MVIYLVILASTCAYPQEFGFDVWTTANGLPQNTVTGLAQAPDGYLWLSTFDGLARFDGVRFKIFNTGNTKGIVNNRFTHVYIDRENTLFGTTDNGIVTVYRNGAFGSFEQPRESSAAISPALLKSDAAGNAVIETDTGDYYFENGQFVPIPGQNAKGRIATYFGRSGAKWVFEPDRVSREKDGQVISYRIELTPLELTASLGLRPYEDKQGALWISRFQPREFVRFKDGAVSVFNADDIPDWNGNLTTTAKEEADGSIYFFLGVGYPARPAQYLRFKDGRFSVYQFPETVNSTDGIVDREGNFWLSTSTGLRRIRKQFITNLTVKDGLNGNEVYPICDTDRGGVLIGSSKGLNLLADGKTTDLGLKYGAESGGLPLVTSGLVSDSENGFWVGFAGGFRRYEDGNPKISGKVEGSATDFTFDNDGNLWIATGGGLLKLKDGVETGRFTTADGLPDNNVVLTHADRNGRLWAGTFDGIALLVGDRFNDFKNVTESPKGYVRAIHEDGDGNLWFGTYGNGLYRYKDGRFFNYRVEHGLYNNGVFAMLEDGRGNFWMSSNRGIHRVGIQELNDFADGKIPKLNSISYDDKDGMLNAECNGGRLPAAIKRKDGKLWFATMGGVAIVDPDAEQVNPNPPPVVIEEVSIDRKPAQIRDGRIELAPGQSNVAIEYTGLSLVRSEQVKFRYKLEGLESDWIEAGTKRSVDYSYLPAGTYTFRVIAANANGIWNNEGAAMKIVVRPYFYQSWWFIGLSAFALTILGWRVYHSRVSRLRAAADARALFSRQLIESQEAERKRIASDLHDGLGQNLVVIKNRAVLATNKGDDREGVAAELASISESASLALEEVREITNNLRPQLLDRLGLTKAIRSMLKKVSGLVEMRSDIDSIDGLFDENDEICIYRIVQEAVNNIVKHSNASNAQVVIRRGPNDVFVEIGDNGQGFDPQRQDPDRRNIGLVGLRERAHLLNASLTIDSKKAAGTRVAMTIPLERKA